MPDLASSGALTRSHLNTGRLSMKDPNPMLLAPRTSIALCLGAVPPLAVGLPTGGLAAVVGGAFAAACPLLMASSGNWPKGAPRLSPLYFAALFLIALVAFDFNSPAFIVDTWSALLLGLWAVPRSGQRRVSRSASSARIATTA
jgi:hypothetical protein